jgi:N-acetylmuramoyl-L-alanine amidase|tara:strand:- start:218 stop:697 length:480 start_codon:yes stop_codon:yes gene_type:complete
MFTVNLRYESRTIMIAAATCLALALFHEARGEPALGQLMVAKVILNRVASDRFPDTVCDVIMQHRQFSFVQNGKFPKLKDQKAWKSSQDLANQILEDKRILPQSVADHYHTESVRPVWRKDLHRVSKIGKHIFLSYDHPTSIKVSMRPKKRPKYFLDDR